MDQSGRAERINRAGARTFGLSGILFEPRSGGSFPLGAVSDEDRARFKSSFSEVDVETQRTVQSLGPMLTVETRLLPGGVVPRERDEFVVAGVRWAVTSIEPRDNGTVRCYLRRA